ncbi:MAG: metal-dependent transcriptional regulator [Clostridia bacterium]|nr:metal-dependent transcriptional regulator [Clostridia bacterium]
MKIGSTHESAEDYLETILILSKKQENVRSIDISKELNFSRASVSRAMGLLKKSNLIEIDENGYITLTKTGLKKANSVYERHNVLKEFLIKVADIDEKLAEDDACRIEHVISEETFEGIKKYLKK